MSSTTTTSAIDNKFVQFVDQKYCGYWITKKCKRCGKIMELPRGFYATNYCWRCLK